MSNVSLERGCDRFVVGTDFWNDLLTWAEETGWQPEHPRESYCGQHVMRVGDDDARQLANTFRSIASDLTICRVDVPDSFMLELMNKVRQLVDFFQCGSFKIGPRG